MLNLAGQFTKIGIICAAVIFVTLVIRLLINALVKDSYSTSDVFEKLAKDLAIALTLIIVAVPEGLPLTIGLSLAYSVERMKKDGILVRNLNSPETMGNIEEICTGKTGTLTKNQMKVVSFYMQ